MCCIFMRCFFVSLFAHGINGNSFYALTYRVNTHPNNNNITRREKNEWNKKTRTNTNNSIKSKRFGNGIHCENAYKSKYKLTLNSMAST